MKFQIVMLFVVIFGIFGGVVSFSTDSVEDG
jgi:hypothetical protein